MLVGILPTLLYLHEAMSWNPSEHSDQDSLTWSYLRAIEWGRWPIFLSQPIAPLLILFFDWKAVVICVVVANAAWALVRYQFVSTSLAYFGALFVKLKWLTIPTVSVYLFSRGRPLSEIITLLWLIIIFIIGIVPTTQVGRIQKMFMNALGYQHIPADLRSLKSELGNLTFNSDVTERLLTKARRRYPARTEDEIYRQVIEEFKMKKENGAAD